MENLNAALVGKQLADLAPSPHIPDKSNLIVPTKIEIDEVFQLLKEGKKAREIKLICVRNRNDKTKPQLSLSFEQIQNIKTAWEDKITELTPKPIKADLV